MPVSPSVPVLPSASPSPFDRAMVEAFVAMLGAFDPECTEPAECAPAVGLLASAERLCALRKAQLARRATAGGTVGRDGAPDAAGWLARAGGTGVGEARAALDTVARLHDCPATAAAMAAGRLSLRQGAEIVAAEAARPGVEHELSEVARREPLSVLREQARRRVHEGLGAEEVHRRQHAARSVRTWTNQVGNVAFAGQLPPEVGVPWLNRLQREADRHWRRARAARGTRGAREMEPREAYVADALVAMSMAGAAGGGARAGDGARNGARREGGAVAPAGRRADVVVVVDLRAWRRGEAEPGEVCHIVSAGGVPVPVARQLAEDAFFKAVVHDGRHILTVAHLGRRMSAELRTALELGRPPDLEGVTCAEEGCGRRHGLEWDHVDPVANGGLSTYDNLVPRCWPHHRDKTGRDRAAGLLGPGSPPPGRGAGQEATAEGSTAGGSTTGGRGPPGG